MTDISLKPNEFIIRLDNEDVFDVIGGKELPNLQLINPHKDDNFDYNNFCVLRLLLESMGKQSLQK